MSRTEGGATATTKIGRNDPCPCGSGQKYKHCCQTKNPLADSPAAMVPASPPPNWQSLKALSQAAKNHWDAGRWAEASSFNEDIVRRCPDNANAHYDLGLAYSAGGRVTEAAASFQRAINLRPGFRDALAQLAYCLEHDDRQSELVHAYRRLSRMSDDPFQRRHYSARALVTEGKLAEAEKELRRLLSMAPQFASARYLLGCVLSQCGMLDEAVQQLSQSAEVIPRAFFDLSTVKRITEADRPLVDRMLAFVERPAVDVMLRIYIHFALGKSFDDLADYPAAMRHYQRANRLRGLSTRLNRPALVAKHDTLIARFTGDALVQAQKSLVRPERRGAELPVFVVGMLRSGSTLVEQILSSHPAVAAGGELAFWEDRLKNWGGSNIGPVEAEALSAAAEDYHRRLRQIAPHALRVIDKALYNFERLWLLRLIYPNARIIHCRRNPVDMCLSIYFTNFQTRHDYAWDLGDLAFFYRQYERLMNHWRLALPADRFTEVDYETLITNRNAETRRLIAFCGLDWDDACLTPERNTRVVQTASLWQARQPVYATSVERWRRYEPWLDELRALLPSEELASRGDGPNALTLDQSRY